MISVVQQDFGRAAALYEESLMLARKAGDKVVVAISLWVGTLAHLGLGDHRLARSSPRRASTWPGKPGTRTSPP